MHRNEDGTVAWLATARWAVANVVPFWDGGGGRAYTRTELALMRQFRFGVYA